MTPRRASLAVGVVLALAACAAPRGSRAQESEIAHTARPAQDLQQHIELRPPTVSLGVTIHIRSVVRNAGDVMLTIWVSDDLRTSGTIALRTPPTLLRFNSIRLQKLAPGDSVVKEEPRVVASPPGQYLVKVHHVVDAHLIGTAEIRVSPDSLP